MFTLLYSIHHHSGMVQGDKVCLLVVLDVKLMYCYIILNKEINKITHQQVKCI